MSGITSFGVLGCPRIVGMAACSFSHLASADGGVPFSSQLFDELEMISSI